MYQTYDQSAHQQYYHKDSIDNKFENHEHDKERSKLEADKTQSKPKSAYQLQKPFIKLQTIDKLQKIRKKCKSQKS